MSKNTINVEMETFMLSGYRPPDTGGDRVAGSVYRLPSCRRTSYNNGIYASRKAIVLRKLILKTKAIIHYLKVPWK